MLLLLLFACSISYGQKLTVTPDGFKNSDDLDKSFVVIAADGKTASQLYNETLKYIAKNYKNPDEVVKGKIENEYLKVITHVTDFIIIKNSFAKVPISADYTFELSFKDGKIKYEIVSLDMYDKSRKFKLLFQGEGAFTGYYIYNKKGELKKPEGKIELENYFNAQIITIEDFVKNKPSVDKW